MSDNLRDRIANTLYQELSIELPAAIRGADAVIEALGLRIQVAGPDGIVGTGNYRYVTEWSNDD